MTITQINNFLKERQPSIRITLGDKIKQEDHLLFSQIMQQTPVIHINNKTYIFNSAKKQYIKGA